MRSQQATLLAVVLARTEARPLLSMAVHILPGSA